MEQGSPFGHSIAAMVVYLHYAHAIGMVRLALLIIDRQKIVIAHPGYARASGALPKDAMASLGPQHVGDP
jgi:hypothetical protein